MRLTAILPTLVFLTLSSSASALPLGIGGVVNDYANLLTPDQCQGLVDKEQKLEKKTSVQIIMLTTPSLESAGIDRYGSYVFESLNNERSILLTYSPDEGDHFRIDVGSALRGAITDGVASRIIRDSFRIHAPKNGAKDFYKAFSATLDSISSIIYTEYAKDPTGASMRARSNKVLIAFVIIGVLVTFIAGCFDPTTGAIVGAICGLFVGLFGEMGAWSLLIMVIGAFLGLVARAVVESGGVGVFDFDFGGGGGGCGGASD